MAINLKYRYKDQNGNTDVVHFETSIEQVLYATYDDGTSLTLKDALKDGTIKNVLSALETSTTTLNASAIIFPDSESLLAKYQKGELGSTTSTSSASSILFADGESLLEKFKTNTLTTNPSTIAPNVSFTDGTTANLQDRIISDEAKLTTLGNNITSLESKITTIGDRIDPLNTRVSTLENRVSTDESNLNTTNANLADLTTRVSKIELGTTGGIVSTITTDLVNYAKDNTLLTTKIETIDTEILQLKSDVSTHSTTTDKVLFSDNESLQTKINNGSLKTALGLTDTISTTEVLFDNGDTLQSKIIDKSLWDLIKKTLADSEITITTTGKTLQTTILDGTMPDLIGAVPARPKKSVVICVAGQSNAVGYDESPVSSYLNRNLNPNRIRQLGLYDPHNLESIELDYCAENFQNMKTTIPNGNTLSPNHPGTKGVHLPLGNLLLNEIPEDYDILFVNCAYGGTGFTTSAGYGTYDKTKMRPNPMTTAYKWGVQSAYYYSMIDRIKYALDLNSDNLFAGVIWIQGEFDSSNASGHKTAFEEMTSTFFSYFNSLDGGKYATRTPKRTWDKDLWYNVETVAYWYSVGQCQQIWDNYKTWNPNTYVEIPRDTDSNAVNGTKATSSTPTTHFGNDAFKKVIAPRIVEKMKENNGLFNSEYIKANDTTTTTTTTTTTASTSGNNNFTGSNNFTETPTVSSDITLASNTALNTIAPTSGVNAIGTWYWLDKNTVVPANKQIDTLRIGVNNYSDGATVSGIEIYTVDASTLNVYEKVFTGTAIVSSTNLLNTCYTVDIPIDKIYTFNCIFLVKLGTSSTTSGGGMAFTFSSSGSAAYRDTTPTVGSVVGGTSKQVVFYWTVLQTVKNELLVSGDTAMLSANNEFTGSNNFEIRPTIGEESIILQPASTISPSSSQNALGTYYWLDKHLILPASTHIQTLRIGVQNYTLNTAITGIEVYAVNSDTMVVMEQVVSNGHGLVVNSDLVSGLNSVDLTINRTFGYNCSFMIKLGTSTSLSSGGGMGFCFDDTDLTSTYILSKAPTVNATLSDITITKEITHGVRLFWEAVESIKSPIATLSELETIATYIKNGATTSDLALKADKTELTTLQNTLTAEMATTTGDNTFLGTNKFLTKPSVASTYLASKSPADTTQTIAVVGANNYWGSYGATAPANTTITSIAIGVVGYNVGDQITGVVVYAVDKSTLKITEQIVNNGTYTVSNLYTFGNYNSIIVPINKSYTTETVFIYKVYTSTTQGGGYHKNAPTGDCLNIPLSTTITAGSTLALHDLSKASLLVAIFCATYSPVVSESEFNTGLDKITSEYADVVRSEKDNLFTGSNVFTKIPQATITKTYWDITQKTISDFADTTVGYWSDKNLKVSAGTYIKSIEIALPSTSITNLSIYTMTLTGTTYTIKEVIATDQTYSATGTMTIGSDTFSSVEIPIGKIYTEDVYILLNPARTSMKYYKTNGIAVIALPIFVSNGQNITSGALSTGMTAVDGATSGNSTNKTINGWGLLANIYAEDIGDFLTTFNTTIIGELKQLGFDNGESFSLEGRTWQKCDGTAVDATANPYYNKKTNLSNTPTITQTGIYTYICVN